jgi:hypothetical protein
LWQDTKPVLVVSSNTNPTDKLTITRKKNNGSTIQIDCPRAINNYNKYMGGVDLNDQLRNYYTFHLKSRKSYKYIFFFLFQLCVTNAFILSKHYSSINVRNIKMFREKLAVQLIGEYCSRKRPGRPNILPPAKKYQKITHFPCKISNLVHRCYYCSHYLHQRRKTTWLCKECNLYL